MPQPRERFYYIRGEADGTFSADFVIAQGLKSVRAAKIAMTKFGHLLPDEIHTKGRLTRGKQEQKRHARNTTP